MSDGLLFLRDFVVVLGIGFLGAFVARRLRLPLLVGYLLGGFIFSILFSSRFTFDASLQTLSEIGVALLLFTLGMEFSFSRVARVKRVVLIGGTAQILLTILFAVIILPRFGFRFADSVFLGSVFALSSTAIVVKILTERGETDTVHGEILVGILLLQDLAVIPLMIILPGLLSLEGMATKALFGIAFSIVKAAAIIYATFLGGRTIIPFVLTRVGKLNSRELLLLTVVLIALGFALLASLFGLPASIGAFLAGLLISETIVNHAVFSEIRPLRDVFSIVFFVLLGMFLSPMFFFANLPLILLLFLFVVIVKSVIVYLLMSAFSYHTKTSFLVAGSLTSVGEFAFVLAGLFVTQNLIDSKIYNLVLSTSLLTLLVCPWQIVLAPRLYSFCKKAAKHNPWLYQAIFGRQDADREPVLMDSLENHVVILGHGRVGRVVARILSEQGIAYIGVDFNLAVVAELKKQAIPFVYGDPSDLTVLETAWVDRARAVVIAVADRGTQELIIQNALQLNPKVKIICRSHFEEDKRRLLACGAHIVVQPEYEAGLSIAQKVVALFGK